MDAQYNLRFAAFPWMTESDWQDHRQKNLHGNTNLSICIMPNYRFVLFQIIRIANITDVSDLTWEIVEISTGATYDVKTILPGAQTCLKIRTNGSEDWIIYDATEAFTADLPSGTFYSVISDGINTWYSEIFKMFCDVDIADVESGIDIGLDVGLVIEHHTGYDDFVLAGGLGNVIP
jgi:hypothetical protein